MTSESGMASSTIETQAGSLLALGVDHRSAPLELREKLSYSPEQQAELITHLRRRAEIVEAAVLSTCNRTELYLRATGDGDALTPAFETTFKARSSEIDVDGRCFVFRGTDVARHALRVASGLESMVLGEPEILGQVKKAAARAEENGWSGPVLANLLQHAITTGGRVRRETAISSGAVSFGYAVVELARSIFSRLEDTCVLIIGAGETARLAARSLLERGAGRLLITNRGRRRAEQLRAQLPAAEIVPYADRDRALSRADVVVASTAALEPVLLAPAVAAAMAERRGRALLAVDLGVPRNIDPAVGQIANVFLQDIDTLEALIERNLKRRRADLQQAQRLIEEEVMRFERWLSGLAAQPLLDQLARHAENLRRHELERLRRQLDPQSFAQVERATDSLVRKLLHHPRRFLRGATGDPLPDRALVRRMFGLEDLERRGR